MRVLLVIPAYNEEENICRTVETINEFRKSGQLYPGATLDYVVINDGSTDNTLNIIKENNINVVNLVMNLGIGGAVQTGYKYAVANGYDIAVQFDGDGQHDINSLNSILKPLLEEGYDLCVGSRFAEGAFSEFKTTFMRRLGIKIISFLIWIVTRKKIYDVTSGYRAANVKVINFFAKRYPTEYPEPESLVQLHKKRFKIAERPVNMMERAGGVSSIHSFKSVKYMIEVGTAILISAFMKERD